MYKFTNGIVVFDEKTKDSYLKAGYKLAENKVKTFKEKMSRLDISTSELIEELNENNSNDGVIKTKPRRSKKVSK